MIGTGSRALLAGYLVGAGLMIIGGLTKRGSACRQSAVRWRVWRRRSRAAVNAARRRNVLSHIICLAAVTRLTQPAERVA